MQGYLNSADGRYYRFKRVCRLERCDVIIYTNRDKPLFCEPNHQQEHWCDKRKRKRKVDAMVLDHEKRMKELEKDQSTLAKRIEKVGREAVKAMEDFRKAWEALKK